MRDHRQHPVAHLLRKPFITDRTMISAATPSAIPAIDAAEMNEMKRLRRPERPARV
jgi:hypothetical protein